MPRKGMHLEGLVKEIWNSYDKFFHVSLSRVDLPLWMKFFDIARKGRQRDASVEMGSFYELWARGIYGGWLGSDPELNGDTIHNSPFEYFKPDLLDIFERDVILVSEVKACRHGQKMNLLDSQTDRHAEFAKTNPRVTFNYIFFKHIFPEAIKSYKGETSELFEQLAESTYCAIVLPFSVIKQCTEVSLPGHYVYRPRRPRFDPCICVSSWDLTRFLFEPEKVIQELKLDENAFTYKKSRVPKIEIAGVKTDEILLAQISEKAEIAEDVPF